MSALTAAITRVRRKEAKAPKQRASFSDTWWRHLIGIMAGVFALFPVWFVASAAFSREDSVSGTSFLPTHPTIDNFTAILQNHVRDRSHNGFVDSRFLHWLLNTILVAVVAALGTVILGSLAAYAFSRFRFRGRRLGMMMLLLIQMFPQLLLVVALYLIVLNAGAIFPVMGLNTFTGLIIVYLGGALGVNAWLLKGFFDTIPSELDESARVDGATAAQIFWGVVLPLAAPVLVVVGLISFISTLNEFVIASAMMQTTDHLTLAVGMNGFIDQQYGQRWGPFAAGALLAAIPAAMLFMSLQKWLIGGLTQGAVKG
ncbi:MAG: arabinogalactan oligomer / maltooligosaccharide transport system permease protein [Gaiellaceae bacterium]|jgi:arabinogalactan oligomer/maltooligosaccharide transport system permease protein|nr:arabinogalactan oligomer / maltooligosaccharide transport system permease protein [Gaiellaceae bacterium]